MPYTAQFFAEKLNVPVEYFNPFRNVQIDPTVNLEELVRVAHSMGEVVGLGLRNLAHCPVELNLMPESTRKWRAFNEKKPYLIATVFTLVGIVGVIGLLFQQLASVKANKLANIQGDLNTARSKNNELKKAMSERSDATNQLGQLGDMLEERYYWVEVLPELRRILNRTEVVTSNKWKAPTGVWIEQFVTPSPAPAAQSTGGESTGVSTATVSQLESGIVTKYNLTSGDQPVPAGDGAAPVPVVSGNAISTITIVCRAMKGPPGSADPDLAYAFLDELKASPIVDPKTTQLGTTIPAEEFTFTFAVRIALKNPLKF
jgi:hypothetical protein